MVEIFQVEERELSCSFAILLYHHSCFRLHAPSLVQVICLMNIDNNFTTFVYIYGRIPSPLSHVSKLAYAKRDPIVY